MIVAWLQHTIILLYALRIGDIILTYLNFLGTDMEKTAKAVNYTVEQTAKMCADYESGVTVEAIAEELGKTVRSVVAKLSRSNVYKKKEYKTKAGEAVIKKDDLADKLAVMFNLTEAEADSMTKANKTALKKIMDKMSGLTEVEAVESDAEFESRMMGD